MAVPNNNTFSFDEICDEIYGNHTPGKNSVQLFADANGIFDPDHVTNQWGYKNNLLNFRNYQHVQPTVASGFGYIYNWYSANDARNIAPPGWHLPSITEWNNMGVYLGGILFGSGLSCAGISYRVKTTSYWAMGGGTAPTNSSGLTVYPSRIRNGYTGVLGDQGNAGSDANFWCSDERSSLVGGYKNINYLNDNLFTSSDAQYYDKRYGFSIRYIKDDSNYVATVTGNSGVIYNTIQIGSQIWTVNNAMCTRYRNGQPITMVNNDLEWAAMSYGAYCK